MSVPFSNTHLRVPRGFGMLMEGLTREILRDQPQDIPAYAARFFAALLTEREESGMDPSEWAAKLEDRFYNNPAFRATKLVDTFKINPEMLPPEELPEEKSAGSASEDEEDIKLGEPSSQPTEPRASEETVLPEDAVLGLPWPFGETSSVDIPTQELGPEDVGHLEQEGITGGSEEPGPGEIDSDDEIVPTSELDLTEGAIKEEITVDESPSDLLEKEQTEESEELTAGTSDENKLQTEEPLEPVEENAKEELTSEAEAVESQQAASDEITEAVDQNESEDQPTTDPLTTDEHTTEEEGNQVEDANNDPLTQMQENLEEGEQTPKHSESPQTVVKEENEVSSKDIEEPTGEETDEKSDEVDKGKTIPSADLATDEPKEEERPAQSEDTEEPTGKSDELAS